MLYRLLFTSILACSLLACGTDQGTEEEPMEEAPEHSVEVGALDFSFTAPEEIKSGWQVFKFLNSGHAEHFFLLNRIPDSIDYNLYRKEITRPFDAVLDSLQAGMSQADAGALLGSLIPAWYFTGVKQYGGTGIIAHGRSAYVAMNLPPGTYVMECYIKEKGVFHTSLGMIRPMVVTEEQSDIQEPEADVELSITNFKYVTKGEFEPGWNTVAVHFKEHPEIGLGNDVHMIELEEDVVLDSVIHWMNWMNIGGMEAPAPATFVGGLQEMPVGETGYFMVKLDSINYTLLGESSASRGMVHVVELAEPTEE